MSTAQDWLRSFQLKRLLGKAHAFAAEGHYDLALRMLTRNPSRTAANIPSSTVPLIINKFYSDICQRIDRMKDAFSGCEIAMRQLDDRIFPSGDVYSDDELKYLRFRCKWILSGVSRFVDSIAFKMVLSIGVTSRDFDTNMVRPHIRRLFPMSEKDGISFDLYIDENRISLSS